MKTFQALVLIPAACTLVACAGDDSGFSIVQPPSDNEIAALVAASAFAEGDGEMAALDRALDAVVSRAHANTVWDTCSAGSFPPYVNIQQGGDTGLFGPPNSAVILNADADYCVDSMGNALDNSDDSKFVSFTLAPVSVSCSWGQTYWLNGSGVLRNNPSLDALPELYGSMTVSQTIGCPDSDGDGVCDTQDLCPNTAASDPAAGVPSNGLGSNRWADMDGDGTFEQGAPGNGPLSGSPVTMVDTAGCNCADIIAAQGLGNGHTFFGCSNGAMNNWVNGHVPANAPSTFETGTFDCNLRNSPDESTAGGVIQTAVCYDAQGKGSSLNEAQAAGHTCWVD